MSVRYCIYLAVFLKNGKIQKIIYLNNHLVLFSKKKRAAK